MIVIPAIDPGLQQAIDKLARRMEQVLFEVKRVIVGQDKLLECVLIALLARGHLLLEGMPGLAKTLTINTLAQALQTQFKRIQFTPDLMPSDLVGSRIFDPKEAKFQTLLGPVFTNLLLADEINRAPPKVQSALLEAMQEGQVTIAGQSHRLHQPFVVMATQNPIETEGTYPLPEAQVDRFMMKIIIGYPSADEEFVVVQRAIGAPQQAQPMMTGEEVLELQSLCGRIYVDPALIRYAVSLTTATREPARYGFASIAPQLMHGASPRASIYIIQASRALAALRARTYVLPEDVVAVAPHVLRHRMALSDEAIANRVEPEAIIQQLLAGLTAPAKPLSA